MQTVVKAPRPTVQTGPIVTKPRGLRKIINKLRRANSVSSPHCQERVSGSSWDSLSSSTSSSGSLLSSWEPETIAKWFDSLGLYMYTSDVLKSVKDGQHLVNICNKNQFAKLGIKNLMHQRKICLAVDALQNKNSDKSGSLDHLWVIRWLEDIGLPQYKDLFLEARIDGRVLSSLTDSDLTSLKISHELHQLSVLTGVRLLREPSK